jgi:hypothetical protein
VFAQDDWTDSSPPASPASGSGQASPRDNVVFEAGLFGGVLGMRRTFILHASGSKLPSDLLGLTCARYATTNAAEMKAVIEQLRKAIEDEVRAVRIEGLWWQFSLTNVEREPSAVSLLKVSRGRDGALELPAAHGRRTANCRRATGARRRRRRGASRHLLLLEGRTALHPNAPQLHGTGEIRWNPPTVHRDTSRRFRTPSRK